MTQDVVLGAKYDDIFANPTVGNGGDSVTATARFYQGLSLPSSFVTNNTNTYAKALPSTTVNHSLPTDNATPAITRHWSSQW